MAEFTTDTLRNIVLLSHSGAGKTILSEAILHAAGVTSRLGTTEDGTTASDFEPEEIRRRGSVETSILNCPWKGNKINLIDTPGYADFRGEVNSGIRVADGAVIVISAPAGVEVGTRQMWKMATAHNLPRLIYISKIDRENANFERVMESITESFGRHCVPVQIPIGEESAFSAIVNILDPNADVPDGAQAEVDAARERLIEAVAEIDDDLATKFLEGEELTQQELSAGLNQGVIDGTIVPVLVGSSTMEIGPSELADAVVDFLPPPSAMPEVTASTGENDDDLQLTCDPSGPLAALVFKTAADPFVGKLSYFRVISGTFKSDSQVWNASTGDSERVGQIFEIRGKSQAAVTELIAGDIGAVPKLLSANTGHTLSSREQPIVLPGIEFPKAAYNMAVTPKTQADVDKMSSSLARISEEDPSLKVTRDPDTLEVILGGLGDTHIEVAVEKMKRKFGVDIELHLPRVPYMESISASAKVEYRHKKQSGGHGQFGHVWLEVESLPRGSGFQFDQKVVGGSVPREYIPSVEKGVKSALSDGAVAGFPVIDVRATLVDGSFHAVDSSGVSFEIAGRNAFTKGLQMATPVLLEPVMNVDISVPDEFTGEVIGDLNGRRGRIQGMVPQGDGTTLITAEVPQGELLKYATELRSQTQGLGSFSMVFDHYEEVPQHMVSKIVEDLEQREKAEA